MRNFSDVVTNFSIGALSKSKFGFYARRLARESATRKLASILMVGLLLFQIFTFLAPPQPSFASSAGDLVAGGPFNKASLIDTVHNQNPAGVKQVFLRLQITQAKMQQASVGTACKGQGWLSMGRFEDAGSSVFQPGIYIGPAESRWQSNCFSALMGDTKVQDTQTGQWYEWGVILDCGNIILKRVPPPPTKQISCQNLNTTLGNAAALPPVLVGSQAGFRGVARGRNIGPNEKVNMAYGLYRPNGTALGEQIGELKRANGIGADGQGLFTDPTRRDITFTEPGTYVVRLWVSFNLNGDQVIASGSATDSCAKQVTVQRQKRLVCEDLRVNANTAQAPFTPSLSGKAAIAGRYGADPTVSKYQYTLLRETTAGTAGATVFNGKSYIPLPGKVINHTNNRTLQDPAAPAQSFVANEFAQTAPGNFLIILRVFDQANVQAADNPACFEPLTISPQPKDVACLNLTASPATADKAPFTTTLTTRASVLNTTVKQYDYDFGDGTKQTVSSSDVNNSLQHTYTKGGRYVAKVVVSDTQNTPSTNNSCMVEITVEQTEYVKTVVNNTILTNDGKPTDANGQTARAGNKLTYTIGVSNRGTKPIVGFVFADDISDILEYADVVDLGGATLVKKDGKSILEWPATDIAVATNNSFVTRSFSVQAKNPLPTTARKTTDAKNFDCQIEDTFFGKMVKTPFFINPAKQIECLVTTIPPSGTLPRTGSGITFAIGLIALFAASSVYLFFRNRLLRRELELVEVLNDGVTHHA